jgi:uncharacterized protein YaaN involved in tellurite resistance
MNQMVLDEGSTNNRKVQLRKNPEVIKLAQSIDYKNQVQLLSLGQGSAEEISKFSDRILVTLRSSAMEESSVLITQLGKIMDKFDSNDFKNEPKGFLSKLFHNAKKQIEKILAKYQTMGGEIEKVYIEICKYKEEMTKSIGTFEQMSEQNFKFYQDLEKYIVAGELIIEDLRNNHLPQLEQRALSGDQVVAMELDALRNTIELLEQRVYSLTMATHVAFQNEPNIRQLQRGNTQLVGKIQDAFITTLPIFKTSIIQAVHAKRQKLVADSMAELDRRTNEMLERNAQNIANQSVEIAKLAGAPGIKIETMEKTWQTIMKGIQDVNTIQQQLKQERASGIGRLEQLKHEYEKLKMTK